MAQREGPPVCSGACTAPRTGWGGAGRGGAGRGSSQACFSLLRTILITFSFRKNFTLKNHAQKSRGKTLKLMVLKPNNRNGQHLKIANYLPNKYFRLNLPNIKTKQEETGEMNQRLRALAALPEVLSSIPSNHMVAHNYL